MVALCLELVLQLHGLLSLGLEELSFLVGISNTTALNLVFELQVIFIYASLLCQGVLDVLIAHSHLIFEIADARLGNGNVDLDETCFLAGLHRLSLRLFGQVAIVKLTCLHILGPRLLQNLVIEYIYVLMETISLFFHLFVLLLLL